MHMRQRGFDRHEGSMARKVSELEGLFKIHCTSRGLSFTMRMWMRLRWNEETSSNGGDSCGKAVFVSTGLEVGVR